MSEKYSLKTKEISLNNSNVLIIQEQREDGFIWNEIALKTHDENHDGIYYIGAYHTFDFSCRMEWMEYNQDYLVILSKDKISGITTVKTIFDFKTKSKVKNDPSLLMQVYTNSFKSSYQANKDQTAVKKLTRKGNN